MRARIALISTALILFGLTGVFFVSGVSMAAPDATLAQEAVPANQLPAVLANPGASPAGIYVFYDYLHLNPQTYPIQGGHISIPWSRVAIGEGTYNWTPVEEWLTREIALGKRVGLGFNSYDGQCCGGSGVPAHVKARYPSSVVYCGGVEIPRYWDPGFRLALRDFVLTLGQRYGNHPNVAWVEVSTGIYGETAPAEDTYNECLMSAGLTSALWIDYVNWATDLYREAFPNTQLFLQFAPTYDQRNERIAFTDHAAAAGVGLKHNGLKPDGGGDAIIDDPAHMNYGGGQYDPVIKWGSQVATSWEAYENQEGSLRGRTATMWGIYNALDKHADHLVFSTELVTAADRQDLFAFANRYLGKTVHQTPSVWVAMRETEYTWFPDYGNFEFWLTQRDSAPGGRTVPLWNVTLAPEGRYARRTDQGSGNSSMFFDVDNRYAFDTQRKATFTGTWVTQAPINLNSYVGRTLKVRFRATTDATTPTTFYVDNVRLNVRLIIPKYWSSAYQNAYSNFVSKLGERYKSDNRVDFVSIGTGLHGETQPCNDEEKGYMKNVIGLTSTQWVNTANAITDMYVSAFSTGYVLRKNLVLQYAPSYLTAYERRDMTNYAAARGVGLSYNGLLPDWAGALTNDGWGAYDPMVAGGRYNYVPIAWETYTYMLCTPVFSYWSLFSGLDKHADYLRVGDDLLREWSYSLGRYVPTVHYPFFEWSKPFWGATPQTTDSVWTVMREHRNPTPYCHLTNYPTYVDQSSGFSTWPQLGNYNFWLYQEDGIEGGRTVVETNDKGADSRYAKNPVNGQPWPAAGLGNCPTNNSYASMYGPNYPCFSTPYNPDLPSLTGSSATNYYAPHSWTGDGKEAWVVRRTDQATSNPYMYFVIDSQYIDGSQTYLAEITVKFFHIGTDTWTLKYDSISGEKVAGTVTKNGSGQVDTKKFIISDAKFAKRLTGGADFFIDSRSTTGVNDGNEWVHMVDVKKLDSIDEPTATPTATATATATHTPTVTPTATPSTGAVSGVAYYDQNGNRVRDAGEPGLAGAEIVLLRGFTTIEDYAATSGPDGSFTLANVAPGSYTLKEKTPPAGYLLSGFTIYFSLAANQTLTFDMFHDPAPTPTPTATATATLTPTPTATATPSATATPVLFHEYLPLLLSGGVS